MSSDLEKQFEKIGAKVRILAMPHSRRLHMEQDPPVRLDVANHEREEVFEISIHPHVKDNLDISVLEVKPNQRHLVLLARVLDKNGSTSNKYHFLCGHDERHLFVAGVRAVSTVADAQEYLKPREISFQEIGLSTRKRNKRKNKVFRRQGEWFFVPRDIEPDPKLILNSEPLTRDALSKPHIAQFAYRVGGVSVMVCRKYPNGLTIAQYEKVIASNPRLKAENWRVMARDPSVYVKGWIRHPDHATIHLDSWHRVYMNTEYRTRAVQFLD